MQPIYILTLLGQFQLTVDGKPISGLSSEKAQALIAYLAAEQGQSHNREQLAELLWPERPEGVARQNLRQTLSRLQRTLPATGKPLFHITRQEVLLNQGEHVQIDLVAFTSGLAEVQRHTHTSIIDCRQCCQQLTDVVALYTGDFLDGLCCDSPALDEWALLKREWLRQEIVRALDLLVQYHEAVSEWQAAHHFAWRHLALDPLHETAHQQIMRALAYTGRSSAALAQYETLTRVLQEELGVKPAATSTALYDAIRMNQLNPSTISAFITAPALADTFSVFHNLPPQQTPFIGRRRELQQIAERLVQTECHMLTLVGPGGVGKTRLALEVARQELQNEVIRYKDGIYFVNLANAETDEQFLTALADAVGYTISEKVQGMAARCALLVKELQGKRLLLLLDNLEQLATTTEVPTAILTGAPHVQLLVTSRIPLHLRTEWLLDISGFDYPNKQHIVGEQSIATMEAVQFFTQSAQRIRANFALTADTIPLVGELAMLVEGVPLALELAAAQMRDVPLLFLLSALKEDLDVVATTMRDVPARHRSLRAVFNHSWRLLSPHLQQLFRRLAVFRGTFEEAAAVAITGCKATELAALSTYSLLRVVECQNCRAPGAGMYVMHEVLHQYAAETLHAHDIEATDIHQKHGSYYLALVAQAETPLRSSHAAQSVAAVRIAFDNIRAAWQWAVAYLNFDALAPCTHSLLRYFILTSQAEEGGQFFDLALPAVTEWVKEQQNGNASSLAVGRQLLADLHALRARLFFKQARYEMGIDHAQQAWLLAKQWQLPAIATTANFYWAICLLSQGEYKSAKQKLHSTLALARRHALPRVESDVLRALGNLAYGQNDLNTARQQYEASLEIASQFDDPRGTSACLGNLGSICRRQGDFAAAEKFLAESLAIHRVIGDRSSEGRTLTHLGELAMDLEEYRNAERYLGEAIYTLRELGELHYMADALVVLGQHYQRQDQISLAIACWEEAVPIYEAANEAPQLAEVKAYLWAVRGV